jgi:predicted O-methyltransferase YrrM
MSDYEFTQDWFHWAPEVWKQLIPMLPGEPGSRNFLEIGSFEGRSTVWIAENMMRGEDVLDCIDTWEGGEEHSTHDMAEVERRFDHNCSIALTGRGICIEKNKGTSTQQLACLLTGADGVDPDAPYYDFIYIDGSHLAKDVLTDACMAWPLLKPKGIMVFDDYLWGDPRDVLHRPKAAIDAFTTLFAEEVEIVHVGYQLIVRKKEGAN